MIMDKQTMDEALGALVALISASDDPMREVDRVREALLPYSVAAVHPVDRVRWIPIDKVKPNDYNPNSVAKIEMGLLMVSIKHDGYTQPVVVVYDEDKDEYVIVDGFHRYFCMRSSPELQATTGGRLPCVVIHSDIAQRMASTVRHNRARGKHSVAGMSGLVFGMLQQGMSDEEICNELGMKPEELLRLKYITGFAKLFEGRQYNKAWKTISQIDGERAWKKKQEEGGGEVGAGAEDVTAEDVAAEDELTTVEE